jgi:hypothetical protein
MPICIPNPGIIAGPRSGGAVPLTAVPYWRLHVISAPNSGTSINQLQMASSPGGANLCTGGTASGNPGSGTPGGVDLPPNAFDGSDATFWGGGDGAGLVGGAWLQYQFASPQLIQEVRVKARNDVFFTDTPVVFAMLASSDGVTFQGAGIFRVGSAWTINQQRTFAVPNVETPNLRSLATVWGVTVTDSANGARLYMAEMEFALVASGADQCTGGVGFHKHAEFNAECSDKLFDNTSALYTARDFPAGPQKAGYVFASPINPVELRLTAASTFGLWANMAKDFTIWWSADGRTENVVATITGQTGWASGETRAFAIPA